MGFHPSPVTESETATGSRIHISTFQVNDSDVAEAESMFDARVVVEGGFLKGSKTWLRT